MTGREPRLGHVIGNYRLIEVVGEGGVGTVYAGEHVRLGRKMAIKLLHADVVSPEVVTRFFNEARAVNAIRHPNIIDVEDFVTAPTGEHYMVMELLEGEDLRTVINRDGVLAPERVVRIGEQLARALDAVHRVGIVHRDLKPDNIFLVQRDGEELVKLLDFGIAKFADTHGLTRAGMTMGTPEYMSPEQILIDGNPGPAGDLYALGMVMYECLAGAPAFTATTTAAVLRMHCYETPPRPSERRCEALPAWLESVVLKCLAKEIEGRFASGADLAAALRVEREVAVPSPEKPRGSRRALLLLPVLAGAALLFHLSRTAPSTSRRPTPGRIVQKRGQTPFVAPRVTIGLVSQPPGAQLFVGKDRRPLGVSPATAELPLGTTPIELVARWDDGTEVSETVVPDHAVRELALVRPAPKPAHRPVVKPSKPTLDRNGVMDPFQE